MAEALEFLLELDAKVDGAITLGTILKQMDASLKGVDAALKKVEQASGAASRGHEKQGKAAEHTGGILHNFLHAILHPLHTKLGQIAEFEFIRRGVDALIEAPKEALHAFAELFEKMIEVSAEAERTELSFKLMFGESEGKETLEWIEKISKFTEFTGKELKGAAQDLAKVGFEGDDLTRALAASLDIAAFDKSGEAGLGGALSSLERVKRTGRVENKTLGGLGIGNDAFYAELSKRTGEGVKVLKKKMEEGKIAAADSLETLYAMIGKKTGKDLGGAGVEMSNTLQARIKHLKELPELFFEKLKGTQGYAAINDFVGHLLEIFSPEGEIGRSIQDSLDKIFNTAGAKLKGINLEAVFSGLPAAITAVTETIKTLWLAFEPFVKGVELVANVLDKINMRDPIKEAATEAHNRAANPELWAEHDRLTAKRHQMLSDKASGQDYVDPDKQFGPQEGYADRAARELKENMGNVGWVAGESFSSKLNKSMTFGGTTGAAGAVAGTKDGLQQHSPSRVFENIGLMAGEGFNQGLDARMRATDDVARGAFAVPSQAGGARGGHTIQIEVNTTVHANGGDANQIAQQVSEQVQAIVPGALHAAIEQMASQAGSA